ncbi:hypothetical protein AX289_32215 [Methylorubrum populi]|nr:hypothetical protein AX289_32215 [Methylorubrum populi]
MTQRPPLHAFLISSTDERADKDLFAVVVEEEAEALKAVAQILGQNLTQVAVVGGMSHKMIRDLGLKPGEVRRV